jgi:hypothetical protein
MVTTTNDAKAPRMSDEAVKAKTGKNWKEWFAILDKAGADKMNHQEIVKYLKTKQGVGPWWQQMVTVTYEVRTGHRDCGRLARFPGMPCCLHVGFGRNLNELDA